nr:NAD(H) kinase 1-like isoform X3 [Tanacetum cinerariifolium]
MRLLLRGFSDRKQNTYSNVHSKLIQKVQTMVEERVGLKSGITSCVKPSYDCRQVLSKDLKAMLSLDDEILLGPHLIKFLDAMTIEGKASAQVEASEWKRKYKIKRTNLQLENKARTFATATAIESSLLNVKCYMRLSINVKSHAPQRSTG